MKQRKKRGREREATPQGRRIGRMEREREREREREGKREEGRYSSTNERWGAVLRKLLTLGEVGTSLVIIYVWNPLICPA